MTLRRLWMIAFLALAIGAAQAATTDGPKGDGEKGAKGAKAGGKGAKGGKGGKQLQPPQPAAEEKTGLKVGAEAPKFTLKDQNGEDKSLDGFLENGRVALVFHRSADW